MNQSDFCHPNNAFRPAPFWAINGKISPDECARQISGMIDVGFSGAFFHSRTGLVTDYLGKEWFDSIEAALNAAKRKAGCVWLYDEDLWPSGNAGGIVAGMSEKYRAALLTAILVPAGHALPILTNDEELRFAYALWKRRGRLLEEYEILSQDSVNKKADCETLLLIRTYFPKVNWWSGESYANLLDPEVTRQFIRLTHEAYREKLGKEFGKAIPGIFTDEPQLWFGPPGIPWYDGLPDVYNELTGRELAKDLPYLFYDGSEARKIRLLVHRTIVSQFVRSFTRPIFEWCERNGLALTGHFNGEDTLASQIRYNCGGVMAHYRYQQLPGIDHLRREVKGLQLTIKQVSSAARQLGRRMVLSEIFAGSRHSSTMEDFKWLADFDMVLGANFFCPHLAWYSANGRRKRDYPPNLNYQQTYFSELRPLNDYLARLGYALTRGKPACEILMLHPIEAATASREIGVCVYDGSEKRRSYQEELKDDLGEADRLDNSFRKALDAILNAGYDCDLGDESYIEDLGRIEGGKFRIGEMLYSVVVIPPSPTWRPRTFSLLEQFAEQGGKILILGTLPREMDCEARHQDWERLAKHKNVRCIPISVREIQDEICRLISGPFSLCGPYGEKVSNTYVHHRIDGEQDILFIVNSDRERSGEYILTFRHSNGRRPVRWDPLDGTCQELSATKIGDDLRLRLSLPPCGSMLITLGEKQDACHERKHEPDLDQGNINLLRGPFEFERSEENVLVIDRMAVSFDGGKSFEVEDFDWRVRRRVARYFGLEEALEWQPWVAARKHLFRSKGGRVVLRYRFRSQIEDFTSFAVIENIWQGSLLINGIPVDVSAAGWHWDKGFGKVEISRYVRKGENELDFEIDYDFLTELEPIYIIGNFAVAMSHTQKGVIIPEPDSLLIGSWSEQGYPFYPGRMTYKSIIENPGGRIFLRLKRPSGSIYKIRINETEAGNIPWRPYQMELTSFLQKGSNLLEIEVVSSMQNVWGPLHDLNGDDNHWCKPFLFDKDSELRPEYNSFNYGLLEAPEIVYLVSG